MPEPASGHSCRDCGPLTAVMISKKGRTICPRCKVPTRFRRPKGNERVANRRPPQGVVQPI